MKCFCPPFGCHEIFWDVNSQSEYGEQMLFWITNQTKVLSNTSLYVISSRLTLSRKAWLCLTVNLNRCTFRWAEAFFQWHPQQTECSWLERSACHSLVWRRHRANLVGKFSAPFSRHEFFCTLVRFDFPNHINCLRHEIGSKNAPTLRPLLTMMSNFKLALTYTVCSLDQNLAIDTLISQIRVVYQLLRYTISHWE